MKHGFHYHLMLLPGIILLLMFSVYPMFGIVMAFQDYNPTKGFSGSPWVGWENFAYMFELPDSYLIFKNTVYLAVSKIMANLLLSLIFALLLNEIKHKLLKRSIQTVVYFPHFVSWVLFGGIIAQIFSLDGVVNVILQMLGQQPIQFMASNYWFPALLVGSDVWKEFGFSTIIFLAALTGINPALYEAASMDGANGLRKMWHVTLPGIRTTVILIAVLSLQNVMNAGFEQILNLYNPLVYHSSDIIDTYVYRIGLLQSQYELGTAVGLLKSVVSILLIVISYKMAVKFANYRIF